MNTAEIKKQVTFLGKRMVELDVKKIKQESEYYDLFLVKSEKKSIFFRRNTATGRVK